jgi:hypothetical protein
VYDEDGDEYNKMECLEVSENQKLLKKASLPYCARSEVLIAAIMKFTVFW